MTVSEEERVHDIMCRPLKAERKPRREDAPKRKRSTSTSSDVGSDAGSSKQKKRRGSSWGKTRAPSSDIVTDDEDAVSPTNKRWFARSATAANVMFTRYAAARRADHRQRAQSMQLDQLACAHGQRAEAVWDEVEHTFNQRKRNAASVRSAEGDNLCDGIPSLPKQGWNEIEKARCEFLAASRGLQAAERRHMKAQLAGHCSLDVAKTLIGARRKSEESLRLALASAHPYRDLHRLRLATTLSQSVADTAAIISLSKSVELSHASATAIAKAKVALFSMKKLVCRFNREVTVCRVNFSGDSSSTSGDDSPVRLQRLTGRDRERFSVDLPQMTTALDEPQASVPDPGVSPRMRVVFSQLNATATTAAKYVAEKWAMKLRQTQF